MGVVYAGEKLPAQHVAMPVCWCSHSFHNHAHDHCSGGETQPCACTEYRPSGARV